MELHERLKRELGWLLLSMIIMSFFAVAAFILWGIDREATGVVAAVLLSVSLWLTVVRNQWARFRWWGLQGLGRSRPRQALQVTFYILADGEMDMHVNRDMRYVRQQQAIDLLRGAAAQMEGPKKPYAGSLN